MGKRDAGCPSNQKRGSRSAPFSSHRRARSSRARDTGRGCITDGPPLGGLVDDVNVGDREERARPVGSSAELASSNHALDSPRRIFELAIDKERDTRVAGREDVLVEDHNAVVLVTTQKLSCSDLS